MAGMRGVNPRQMQQAMKKMGIKQTNINDVVEVIIRTKTNEIVITHADVVCVDMQGSKSYQISGDEHTRPVGATSSAGTEPVSFPAEDIDLVISQTGCDRDTAVKAIESAKGQPAEAILNIMTK
ncbi:MAG: nascent polypeptide-associated complex protein [Candidatus Methanoplasma sp.]|jgi:nascent polypeptide-associated complex subunit alpha|nr:nascent polypeptide-associated complex protein [Candidatus Methanoplasma sp.]